MLAARLHHAPPIESSVQLLVEGNDQRNFFEAMVERLKLLDVQVRDFGGVTELRRYLAAFVNEPGFRQVRRIGIVRDAETSAEGAFASVRSSLENAAFPFPTSPPRRRLASRALRFLFFRQMRIRECSKLCFARHSPTPPSIDASTSCSNASAVHWRKRQDARTRRGVGCAWRPCRSRTCRSASPPSAAIGT